MNLQDKTAQLLDYISQAGAKHADAIAVNSTGKSIQVRHGKVESIEAEHAQGIGLRGFVETNKGLAFASASSSDLSDSGLKSLAQQVVDMAKISEPDPDVVAPVGANHPSTEDLAAWQETHPHIHHGWDTEAAKAAALQCEETALGFDDKIQNSEGATAGFGDDEKVYACSDGFVAKNRKSSSSLSVSVIAGEGENMQRDYAWHSAFQAAKLRTAKSIGEEAAHRAASRLGSKVISSRTCPVLFEPRIASSIFGHLFSAINGRAVLQKRSFLADDVGKALFPSFVTVEENPDHPQGMANRLFDGEGTLCQQQNIVKNGKLTTLLTNRYVAKRLNIPETGNASRGLTGDIGIGTSNIIVHGGDINQQAIMQDIQDGFFVTELMGFGINPVTGDYSRGAAGFLIENGVITQPVQEVTIAGNLRDMFQAISHVGNDVTWFGSTAVPSIVISDMTIAGQ
ncbi:TldD/PmbA family protein [Ghiorsea bivora]|uniref:TldD/PmbA family protein n=1 Tax=Ghiorsea bivora TaxID=1485545 RepID=UPI0005711960|nr:TldD/PmbA family protein [Ghiorsea bivora]